MRSARTGRRIVVGPLHRKDMEKQYRIEDADWRLQAVTTILSVNNPWPGMQAKPGDVLKVCATTKYNDADITLGIPSAVALFLDIAFSAFRGIVEMRETAITKREKDYVPDGLAFQYFERLMISIVFSFTALESFANEEIPQDCVHHQKIRGIFAALFKRSIERRVNLDTKLGGILPQVMKIASPKGSPLWTDYLTLKEARDRIVHLKSCDREVLHHGPPSIWQLFFSPTIPFYPNISRRMIAHFQTKRDEKRVARWFKLLPF